jgi:hypothetical protein
MKSKRKWIDWQDVQHRENYFLKYGRWPNQDDLDQSKANRKKPVIYFGMNTVKR